MIQFAINILMMTLILGVDMTADTGKITVPLVLCAVVMSLSLAALLNG